MALPRRAFALAIGLSGGVAADLGDRHDVQTEVELAVPGPGQSMAHDITRGHLDWGGAGVGGERRRGGEPVGCQNSGLTSGDRYSDMIPACPCACCT